MVPPPPVGQFVGGSPPHGLSQGRGASRLPPTSRWRAPGPRAPSLLRLPTSLRPSRGSAWVRGCARAPSHCARWSGVSAP
eukprot:5574019-Alexandrium_andersonii.AAC.1